VSRLEQVARRRIIFTTPNGPFYRGGHDTPLGFNEHEAPEGAPDADVDDLAASTDRGVAGRLQGRRIAPREALDRRAQAFPAAGGMIAM